MGKKKKDHLDKTLVEKILDKENVSYTQLHLPFTLHHHAVATLEYEQVHSTQYPIYKTLALIGNKTGPIIAVIPIEHIVNYKKLAKVSQNKKVGMVPLKDLIKTTGYEHGANTPIGIYETHHYPIYIDHQAEIDQTIVVSSGKIGRSISLRTNDLARIVKGVFADISEEK